MSNPSRISELIERSSLGTAGARSLCDSTPPEAAQKILDRAAEYERATGDTTASADLLARIGAGDPVAWEDVLRRYGKLVSTTVRSFRLQDADALDVVQTTWLRLADKAHRHRIKSPERLGGWLAATARRECLYILRRCSGTSQTVIPDVDPSAEQHVIEAHTSQMLQRLITELPPRQRTLLRTLFTDAPRSYAEVAGADGIPLGGIGPTRLRALQQLRAKLDAFSIADEQALDQRTAQLEQDQAIRKQEN
jgi:RNA polymerase sigma factor (sigma-70 family)